MKNINLSIYIFNYESYALNKMCNIPRPSTVIPIPLLHRPWNSATQLKQVVGEKRKCYFQCFIFVNPKPNPPDLFSK